mgnify:CR=1 FL=1
MSKPAHNAPTFQEVVLRLQTYWAAQGCVILQPYDNEVGAGTNHPATTLRSLGPDTWRAAVVLRTAATARIRTACSTTTSSKC